MSDVLKLFCYNTVQYVDAVCLAWGADTVPVKQKHDHHVRRILRILNRGEGNGKQPRLKSFPRYDMSMGPAQS